MVVHTTVRNNTPKVSTVQTIDAFDCASVPFPSLGTDTKFASTSKTALVNKRDEATIKRFQLQRTARSLLPTHRVSFCLRNLQPHKNTVTVMSNPQADRAYFDGLWTCDSVWDCPVCAAKITEYRREELSLALARAHEDGLVPVLITWTLQHDFGDKLRDSLDALLKCHRALKSGRAFQDLKKEFGWVGSVRSLEVTHGYKRKVNNGFHPHSHELAFVAPATAAKLRSLEDKLFKLWSRQLERHGFSCDREHGVKVVTADTEIMNYVAKFGHEPKGTTWTVERELAKAPAKMASSDGLTPFQLLELASAGDEYAGRLFVEYSNVFHGRAQLVWSRGLRDLLGLNDEKTDSDIVAQAEPECAPLLEITRLDWYRLVNLKTDIRGEILNLARRGDTEAILRLIDRHIGSPPDHYLKRLLLANGWRKVDVSHNH